MADAVHESVVEVQRLYETAHGDIAPGLLKERRHQAAVERIEQRAAGDRSPGGAEDEIMRKALKQDDHDDENAAADEERRGLGVQLLL